MATEVKFTDGTTTVTFDGVTDGSVSRYDPEDPTMYAVDITRATVDGEESPIQTYRNIPEDGEFVVRGTLTQMQTTIRKLNKLFERARRVHRDGLESSVYIHVKLDGEAVWWRSELVRVNTTLEPSALDLYLDQGSLVIQLNWVRRFYWEQANEVTLSMYNPGQAKTTSPVPIHGTTDSGRYDYVDIDNSDIAGDMEAPVAVQLYNSYNDTDRLGSVYAGLNYRSNPASLVHIIEGESTAYGTQQPGSSTPASYSGGYYRSFSWSGTGENNIALWTLGQTLLNACKGNHFRFYARFATAVSYADLYLRLKVTLGSMTTTLWRGPQVLVKQSTKSMILGSVQLPPYKTLDAPYPLELVLTAQRDGAGPHTLNLDYFRLLPMDEWRDYQDMGYGTAYGVTLVDDGPNDIVYTSGWSPSGIISNYIGLGPKLMVHPTPESTGRHRVVFAMGDVFRTATVKLTYRLRRRVL